MNTRGMGKKAKTYRPKLLHYSFQDELLPELFIDGDLKAGILQMK